MCCILDSFLPMFKHCLRYRSFVVDQKFVKSLDIYSIDNKHNMILNFCYELKWIKHVIVHK